jgi:hypothetical protein
MRNHKSPARPGFTRFGKVQLQKGLKEVREGRTSLRLTAVLLCAKGMNIPTVAKLLNKSFQIVYRWVEAMFDMPKSGRPLSALFLNIVCPGYHLSLAFWKFKDELFLELFKSQF